MNKKIYLLGLLSLLCVNVDAAKAKVEKPVVEKSKNDKPAAKPGKPQIESSKSAAKPGKSGKTEQKTVATAATTTAVVATAATAKNNVADSKFKELSGKLNSATDKTIDALIKDITAAASNKSLKGPDWASLQTKAKDKKQEFEQAVQLEVAKKTYQELETKMKTAKTVKELNELSKKIDAASKTKLTNGPDWTLLKKSVGDAVKTANASEKAGAALTAKLATLTKQLAAISTDKDIDANLTKLTNIQSDVEASLKDTANTNKQAWSKLLTDVKKKSADLKAANAKSNTYTKQLQELTEKVEAIITDSDIVKQTLAANALKAQITKSMSDALIKNNVDWKALATNLDGKIKTLAEAKKRLDKYAAQLTSLSAQLPQLAKYTGSKAFATAQDMIISCETAIADAILDDATRAKWETLKGRVDAVLGVYEAKAAEEKEKSAEKKAAAKESALSFGKGLVSLGNNLGVNDAIKDAAAKKIVNGVNKVAKTNETPATTPVESPVATTEDDNAELTRQDATVFDNEEGSGAYAPTGEVSDTDTDTDTDTEGADLTAQQGDVYEPEQAAQEAVMGPLGAYEDSEGNLYIYTKANGQLTDAFNRPVNEDGEHI